MANHVTIRRAVAYLDVQVGRGAQQQRQGEGRVWDTKVCEPRDATVRQARGRLAAAKAGEVAECCVMGTTKIRLQLRSRSRTSGKRVKGVDT
jgi:hypothetical protein